MKLRKGNMLAKYVDSSHHTAFIPPLVLTSVGHSKLAPWATATAPRSGGVGRNDGEIRG